MCVRVCVCVSIVSLCVFDRQQDDKMVLDVTHFSIIINFILSLYPTPFNYHLIFLSTFFFHQ